MDYIKPVERKQFLGLLADTFENMNEAGKANQIGGLLELMSVPAMAKTLDRLSWGDNLTTGKNQTLKFRPEVVEAMTAFIPAAANTTRAANKGAKLLEKNALPWLDSNIGGFVDYAK